ncbi:hypothetical protein SAMN04488038_10320 [Solimonas aquatica]|uniref:Uncharacterized protein n=1 Tax=Solimonas aquatica TaxID=489703 RepID=A0A1H9CDU2_9GAMM|nr:hypothetical protein [Solimonas aquatica]SEP99395.1 hypothetical protein SAMN04488038_10320 [Solimonas aquatica]
MENTLPMLTFVVLTTGLCIIALTGLIFSDWVEERRAQFAFKAASATRAATLAMEAPQRRATPAQELIQALKKAA